MIKKEHEAKPIGCTPVLAPVLTPVLTPVLNSDLNPVPFDDPEHQVSQVSQVTQVTQVCQVSQDSQENFTPTGCLPVLKPTLSDNQRTEKVYDVTMQGFEP